MYNKKVKIVATIGPASDSMQILLSLAKEGVDVFRINLSHQPHEEVAQLVTNMRVVEDRVGRPITIMGDLAGPKIRIGKVGANVTLMNNDEVEIVSKAVV